MIVLLIILSRMELTLIQAYGIDIQGGPKVNSHGPKNFWRHERCLGEMVM